MSVGVNAILIAIGSVLAFAVHAAIAGIDIFVLGWLLIGAGVLGLILTQIVNWWFKREHLKLAKMNQAQYYDWKGADD